MSDGTKESVDLKCDVCNGEGRVAYIQSEGGYSDPADCYKCKGTGCATHPAAPAGGESEREAALVNAALDFVAKVERGDARSTASYAAFKSALASSAKSNGDEEIKLLRADNATLRNLHLNREAETAALRAQLAKATAALKFWSDRTRLQTFEDRERFRNEAAEVLKEVRS